MKSSRRFFIILLAVCLAILASLPTLTRGPGNVVGSSLPAVALPQAQTSLALPGQPVRFEQISTADGLSFPIVRQIVQDWQGFTWFATDAGLNRYDGYEFVVYEPDPSDPASLRFAYVTAIHIDRDGDLWVGHGGGLDRFNRTTGTFTHVDTRGQVYSIYEDSAGTLWVGFWHGLYGYDRATGAEIYAYQYDADDPGSLSNNGVVAIYKDQAGDLWIGTTGGLDRLDRTTGTFTHYQHDPDDPTSLSHNQVNVIFEDRQGVLWIGTNGGGFSQLDRATGTFIHYRRNPEDVEHSLGNDRVSSILEDSAGMLWVGTDGGLDQFDRSQNRFVHFRHNPLDPHSLSDDVVLSLYEDRSGMLWIGTANGVSIYKRRVNQFTHYQKRLDLATDVSQPPGLSNSVILAIHEDQHGALWTGTLGGLDRLDRRSGDLTVYPHDPADPGSPSDDMATAVYEDRAGVLWIGTSGGWLEQFDPQTETFVHYRHLDGLIRQIAEDQSGNLWIGAAGLYRLDRAREALTHYTRDPDNRDSLSHDNVRAIHIDPSGALWVGTLGGINFLDDVNDPSMVRFKHYRRDPGDPNSLNNEWVLSFYQDPILDEEIWIGTWGGGLGRFDRATQTFTHYTEKDGLLDDIVSCILADSAGFLWLGTPRGLSRFDPRSESFRNYDRRDGVQSGITVVAGDCFQSQTGEMFFGGVNGIDAFYPEQIEENLHIPPIAITALKLFNQTVRRDLPPDEHIKLSHQENFVSFEFAALDYTIPEKNQYAYMMEGLDEGWVYAGTRRHADYPNLPPGDYVFRVKGSNNDGVWNEEGIAVRITVEPPIWGTWVFGVMVVFALVGGVIGVYRQRVRNIEARSRELEALVEQRTAELRQSEMEKAIAAERSRLARELHDAVTQTLFSASLIADVLPRVWAINQEKGRQQLEEVRLLTRGALAEMRGLLLELRPEALSKAKMGDLLRQLGRAMTGRTGAPVTVTAEGQWSLPPSVQIALYRIAQEALNNAGKHADASQVNVRFTCEPGRATLSISDDGQGFDIGAIPPGHFGVGIMRERAGAIGAVLEVTSQPGAGAQVMVDWQEQAEEG